MKWKFDRNEELNTYNASCIDTRTDNFQAYLIFGRYNHIFFLRSIAWRIAGWTELHVSRNGLERRNKIGTFSLFVGHLRRIGLSLRLLNLHGVKWSKTTGQFRQTFQPVNEIFRTKMKNNTFFNINFNSSFRSLSHEHHFIAATHTLLTCVTTASNTSPLNGRKTIALYFTGYTTNPWPGWN